MLRLKDYKPPEYAILETRLFFDLFDDHCLVRSELDCEKIDKQSSEFVLDGEELELVKIAVNGKVLSAEEYVRSEKTLTLKNLPDRFHLQIEVRIHPEKNTSLGGLYQSGPFFLTQCEPQYFRRITYFLDRPDVMSMYTVSIEADKKYPVLLSNGDRIEKKDLPNGRHLAVWRDPFKKPSYLFALVVGDFGVLEDQFTTRSGRKVALQIYSDPAQISKCRYAMESLKSAMKWEEERYGLEYDLATYMIVAVDDFNGGAMENKGLNVFNSRLIIADPTSATDGNYQSIEAVVAHEYFHNWTGNRVTLRDWFHLSLKEGLTVFREHEYLMDRVSRDLIRIESVAYLRDAQFPEDQGPNSHPIRPESCYSVDNFFTTTIYEKGAEVIRMMQTLVGRPGFRRGMDLYVQRYDGQAVIIEDFARAIAEANNESWDQFQLWYSQAGTPRVHVEEVFDSTTGAYSVHFSQHCPSPVGQPAKKPFHIPLSIELFSRNGDPLPIQAAEITVNTEGRKIFHLRESTQKLQLVGLRDRPVLSLNREFSAPIELEWQRPDEDLFFLYAKDTDAFNRWEAGQKLMQKEIHRLIDLVQRNASVTVNEKLATAMAQIIDDESIDQALRAMMIEPPSLAYLAQTTSVFDAAVFEKAYHCFFRLYGQRLIATCTAVYNRYHGQFDHRIDPQARATRSLKNACLQYLCWGGAGIALAVSQFQQSPLMTDQEVALSLLCQLTETEGETALAQFYERWKNEPLVLNKWWSLQAATRREETFARVKQLGEHPAFRIKNPNCVYSLYRVFGDNLTQFHRNQGECYSFFARKILEIDQINPQVAARIASAFDFCTRVDAPSRARAREAIQGIVGQKLSENTFEILSKTLTALTPPSVSPGSKDHATEVS